MSSFFLIDSLSIICLILILLVASVVFCYAKNYLNGENKKTSFLINIVIISSCLIIFVISNNIFILCLASIVANIFLVAIMIYKKSWRQAFNSGIIALKNFILGGICFFIAMLLLYKITGSYLLSEIMVSSNFNKNNLLIICTLITIAVFCQSAIYPFHSWLVNSLNSPTPTSALMHAGIINGGGIILTKFAFLFLQLPNLLTFIFVLATISMIIGNIYKLIQSDVKSMLAYSTMCQMGFMILQCSIGAFPSAIAHLFWHSMFKAYLFLSSASSWQEKNLTLVKNFRLSHFCLAVSCGIFGSVIFVQINQLQQWFFSSILLLIMVCFCLITTVALIIIDNSTKKFISALLISGVVAIIYACSLWLIKNILPNNYFMPQELNIWHIMAMILLFVMWLFGLFWQRKTHSSSPIILKLYVKLLNLSSSKTITLNRNQYNYE